MRARARSRGTPPTAGVGMQLGHQLEGGWGRCRRDAAANVPTSEVPRWVMLWRWTRSGMGGDGEVGAQAAPGLRRCRRPPVGARRCPWSMPAAPAGGGPATAWTRSVVPARGRLSTRRPTRSTSSSGLAPTNWPSEVGREKTAQFGSSSCHPRSSAPMSMDRPMRTSTCRATTTLATSPDGDGPDRIGHHGLEGLVGGSRGDAHARRTGAVAAARADGTPPRRAERARSPAASQGQVSRGPVATTVTHSRPSASRP